MKFKSIIQYKVGSQVEEDDFYVCVPYGYRRYLRAGTRFPSCLKCFGKKQRRFLRKSLEVWRKSVDSDKGLEWD